MTFSGKRNGKIQIGIFQRYGIVTTQPPELLFVTGSWAISSDRHASGKETSSTRGSFTNTFSNISR